MKRWLIVLLVLGVAACSPAPDSPTDRPAADASAGAGTVAALDFTADLVDGGQLDGGDLEGRDVVLWFWAPW